MVMLELDSTGVEVATIAAYWPPAGASSGTLMVKRMSAESFGEIVPLMGESIVIQSTIWLAPVGWS